MKNKMGEEYEPDRGRIEIKCSDRYRELIDNGLFPDREMLRVHISEERRREEQGDKE